MILVIDNYDSFAHNLARYFRQLDCQTSVERNDAVTARDIESIAPTAIVISPGPCTPNEAGCSLQIIREYSGRIPILGICLGHQAIVQAFGGRIVRSLEPTHGISSDLHHNGQAIFHGFASPQRVARYHSLIAADDPFPECLRSIGWLANGTTMAVAHKTHPTIGLQFHPESVLTENGYEMLAAFLQLVGIADFPRRHNPHFPACFLARQEVESAT